MKKIFIFLTFILLVIPNITLASNKIDIGAQVDSWLGISFSLKDFSIYSNFAKGTNVMVENKSNKSYDNSTDNKSILSNYSFVGESTFLFEQWIKNSSDKKISVYVTNNF